MESDTRANWDLGDVIQRGNEDSKRTTNRTNHHTTKQVRKDRRQECVLLVSESQSTRKTEAKTQQSRSNSFTKINPSLHHDQLHLIKPESIIPILIFYIISFSYGYTFCFCMQIFNGSKLFDILKGEVVESPYKKCRSWSFECLEKDEEDNKTLELFPLHPEGRSRSS